MDNAKRIIEDILKGMQMSKEAMIKEGLWNENTTFDEWARYAGSHILIAEKELLDSPTGGCEVDSVK